MTYLILNAPGTAKELKVEEVVENPLTMFDWTSYRFAGPFTVEGKR
ncbi:MAG: hypothetical protein QM796_21995 [Chthoniobacteraceae bacterium]